MAYQFSDGFDAYTTITQRWDATQGTLTIGTGSARFAGSGGITSQGVSCANNSWFRKNLSSNQATLIMGVACKWNIMPVGVDGFMFFEDNTTTQVSLAVAPSGAMQFYRGAPTTNPIGPSSTTSTGFTFTAGVWHYVEMKVTIDPSAGSVECHVDGSTVISATGSLNTRASTNSFANQIRVGESQAGVNPILYDDLYCLDSTGGSLNTFLGDRRIITAMPAGAGSYTNFSHTGASTNWQSVNEIPPNDDTSYVSDSTVSDRDSYTIQTVTFNGNADFMNILGRVRKDDAGTHLVQLSTTNGSGTHDLFGSNITVPSSYAYFNSVFTTCADGSVLSATNINNSEIGIKILS